MDIIPVQIDSASQASTLTEQIILALADDAVQATLAVIIEAVLTELLSQQAQESNMPGAYQRQGGF